MSVIIAQIQTIANNINRLLGRVKISDGTNDVEVTAANELKVITGGDVSVTTIKPDGTNTMPSLDAKTRPGFMKITDGTDDVTVHGYYESGAIGTAKGFLICGWRSVGSYVMAIPCAIYSDPITNIAQAGIPVYNVTTERREGTKITDGTTTKKLASGNNGAAGGTPQTVAAAAGAGVKNRIHTLIVSVNTAGTVTCAELNLTLYMAANATEELNWDGGCLQNTANTAIALANAGGGNIAAHCTYNTE